MAVSPAPLHLLLPFYKYTVYTNLISSYIFQNGFNRDRPELVVSSCGWYKLLTVCGCIALWAFQDTVEEGGWMFLLILIVWLVQPLCLDSFSLSKLNFYDSISCILVWVPQEKIFLTNEPMKYVNKRLLHRYSWCQKRKLKQGLSQHNATVCISQKSV